VAGLGVHTFVAVGAAVYRLNDGEPVELVGELQAEALSLAPVSASSLFYATADTVGHLRPGKARTFAEKKRVQLAAEGEDLYLLVPGEGIVKYCPATELAASP
jgi:hypothetical protein